jgi:hypothetical protein
LEEKGDVMLLNNILLAIKEGKTIDCNDLAEKLDEDINVVDAAIGQLCQMGYMQTTCSDNTACGSCGGCGFSGECGASGNRMKLWMVTEKGDRYIKSLLAQRG